MKTLLTLLTCLFILSPNVVLSETEDDLVYRDGLFYKKFSDVPFSGKFTQRNRSGSFKDGKEEGPWVQYHENGQLYERGNWKNGKREGAWVTYKQGGTVDKEETGTYKHGLRISD